MVSAREKVVFDPNALLKKVGTHCVTPVSYTHLDVYKRQEDAVLTPALCETARRILLAQRDKAYLMHAMPKQRAAHKTGELPGIRHDAGILYGRKRTVGFSVLTQSDNENSGTDFLRQAGVLLRAFL